MIKEHFINYRIGYNYVLGSFNPTKFYTQYISLENEAFYFHEVNHAQMCAGSVVHMFGSLEQLFELFPNTKPDFSIVMEFRDLFEGIVKAFAVLNPLYRKEEEIMISKLKNFGIKLLPFDNPKRDKIAYELVSLVKQLNKEQRFSASRVCRQVSRVFVTCKKRNSNRPCFNEVLGVIKCSIGKLRKFNDPIHLYWRILQEVISSDMPNVDIFEGGEIHAEVWSALELCHLALEYSLMTRNFYPLMISLSSILNFVVPGCIFPFVIVFPIDRDHSIGIYTGEVELQGIRKRVKRRYCILSSFLQEFIDNIFRTDYRKLSNIQEIYDLLWDFLMKVENLWVKSPPKCPDCGLKIRSFSDDGRIASYVLKNSAYCKGIFDKARGSYLKWFTEISAIEAQGLLSQFKRSQ